MQITEFAGRISIKYNGYKISQDTLSRLIAYAIEKGIIYPEKIGKDKLQTLIYE